MGVDAVPGVGRDELAMGYYTVVVPDTRDVYGIQRFAGRLEVSGEFSRHGQDEAACYLTWPDDEVPLEYAERVAQGLSCFEEDVAVYKDIVERPYRFQPQPLDHGNLVRVFNEGIRRGYFEPAEPLPLPEATLRAVKSLQREGRLSRQLEVKLQDDGVEITAFVSPNIRKWGRLHEEVYEAVEGTGRPDFLVTLKMVERDVQWGPLPGVVR